MTPVEAVSGGVPAKPGEPGPGEAVKPQAECRKLGGGLEMPSWMPEQLEPNKTGLGCPGLESPLNRQSPPSPGAGVGLP